MGGRCENEYSEELIGDDTGVQGLVRRASYYSAVQLMQQSRLICYLNFRFNVYFEQFRGLAYFSKATSSSILLQST